MLFQLLDDRVIFRPYILCREANNTKRPFCLRDKTIPLMSKAQQLQIKITEYNAGQILCCVAPHLARLYNRQTLLTAHGD
jgi:hypothetical protein